MLVSKMVGEFLNLRHSNKSGGNNWKFIYGEVHHTGGEIRKVCKVLIGTLDKTDIKLF